MPDRPMTRLATADCHGCQWTDSAAGCQGRAAQHHDRTGHEVEVNIVIHYGDVARQFEELDLAAATPRPQGTLI